MTIEYLRETVERLNKAGYDLKLRRGYGKIGIAQPMNEQGGQHNVTGLMSKRELGLWLDGFEAAINYSDRMQRGEVT